MTSQQQAEALRYFKDFARDWERKAMAPDERRVNVIKQRNDYVLSVIAQRPHLRRLLDVGCGTGDLVIAAALRGVAATGLDFAEEMIAIGRPKATAASLSNAEFICASIFDYPLAEGAYDIVAANGFIEYISPEQLDQFLALARRVLGPGGSLVLGSRNRLFNLFSLNAYTTAELEGGWAERLLAEAVALSAPGPLNDLLAFEPVPLPPAQARHADTGIQVGTRHQYTPVQLMRRAHAHGFAVEALLAIHVHGVPPAFKINQPAVHTSIANLLQPYASEHRALLPFASSFMLHAVNA